MALGLRGLLSGSDWEPRRFGLNRFIVDFPNRREVLAAQREVQSELGTSSSWLLPSLFVRVITLTISPSRLIYDSKIFFCSAATWMPLLPYVNTAHPTGLAVSIRVVIAEF